VTDLADPDLWLVRDCLLDDQSALVHTFWDAKSFDSNQLPGQLTFDKSSPEFYQSHVYRNYPSDPTQSLPSFPDRVTLEVYLQPFGLDVFDDLFSDAANVGLTPDDVQALRAKLTPLNVGTTLEWTAAAAADTTHGGSVYFDQGVPVQCVTT